MRGRNADILAVVDSAYQLELDDSSWLDGVARACCPLLDTGFGLCVFEFKFNLIDGVSVERSVTCGMPDGLKELYPVAFRSLPPEVKRRPFMLGPCITASTMTGERSSFRRNTLMQQHAQRFGMFDSVWVTGLEPSGAGVGLHAGRSRITTVTKQEVQRWAMLGAHLSAALRLRRKLANSEMNPGGGAVFTPDGTVAHASGDACETETLQRLRGSVLKLEEARRTAQRTDDELFLPQWKVLTDARWSLLAHFENDGRRYLVARENAPSPPGVGALTPRERQVVGCAAIGHDNKVIAYELGISHSTVRVLLARAAAKLGVNNRAALVAAYRANCAA